MVTTCIQVINTHVYLYILAYAQFSLMYHFRLFFKIYYSCQNIFFSGSLFKYINIVECFLSIICISFNIEGIILIKKERVN